MPRRKPTGILAPIFSLCALIVAINIAHAQEVIDFEDLSPELPGWAGYGPEPDGQRGYRAAVKWDTPFTISLDNSTAHTGTVSLKCEASQEASEMSVVPPIIPASGTIAIRFFVRTSGLSDQEGTALFSEIDSSGKSSKKYSSEKIASSDNEWVEVVWSSQLSPETTGIRLLVTYKQVPAGAKVWLDDITVKPVEN